MKHIYGLLIKYGMTAFILEFVLGALTDLTFSEILLVALVLTIAAYLIGDLLILPASNNLVAAIADAGLSFIVIFAFNYAYAYARISYTAAIVSAVILAVGEWFFHKYVARAILPNERKTI